MPSPKSICPKVNVIARLVFEIKIGFCFEIRSVDRILKSKHSIGSLSDVVFMKSFY